MGNYPCQYCGQSLMTQSAKAQHEANCSENPANAEVTDE